MLKNRPAAFLCLFFSAGTAAGLFFGSFLLFALCTLFAFSVLLFISRRKRSKVVFALALGAIALLMGASYLKIYSAVFSPYVPDKNTSYSFTAAVRQVESYSTYKVINAKVQDGTSPFDGDIFRMYVYTEAPSMGEMIRVDGKVEIGDSDDRGNGIKYKVSGSYTHCPELKPKGFFFKVLDLRLKVCNVIDRAYGEECSAFYKALLTGDRSELSPWFNADFARSGLSHVIAISGQHFSIIIMGIYSFLMTILGNKKLCCGIAAFLAVAYMVFTGASPSIVRAAFMCCVVLITAMFNEQSDSLINLSVSLVIILLFNPFAIQNIGLQLSYAATIGIIFTMDHIERFYQKRKTPKLLRIIVSPLALSVSATMFCTPVFMSSFKQISVTAPLSNILVDWMISLAMVFGILLLPVSLLWKKAAIIPLALYNGINGIAEWISDMRFACVSVNVPYMWLLALPSLAICVGFAAFRPKRGILIFLSAFLSAVLIVTGCLHLQGNSHKRNALIYVKDGTYNSFTFYSDKDSTVLIDGVGDTDASTAVMANGYTYLDAYIMTSCTKDSYTRLISTLPYLAVNKVYVPEDAGEYYNKIIEVAFIKDCEVVVFKGSSISFDELTVYIPQSGNGGHTVKVERNGKSLLVLGANSGETDFYIEKTSAVIFSKAAAESSAPYSKLPIGAETLFIPDGMDYKGLLKSGIGKSAELYSSNDRLRFGKDGIFKE